MERSRLASVVVSDANDALLALANLHIICVLIVSVMQGQNLIATMLTGKKKRKSRIRMLSMRSVERISQGD